MKLSNTSQRRIIVEELKKLDTHPTADELYTIVRQRLPQISLGTVYRNLELLAEAGRIQKLELTGRQKRFDGRPEAHFHMRCRQCGRVVDICDPSLGEIDRALNSLIERLHIDSYRLELNGLCMHCKNELAHREPAALAQTPGSTR